MGSTFREDISDSSRFVVTMELVPGEQSKGRSVDTVMTIAEDALSDGRISAVTITDNPGGHPSLSPDVLGKEINPRRGKTSIADKAVFQVYRAIHRAFFHHDAPFGSTYSDLCARLDKRPFGYLLVKTVEDVSKKILFSCQECGDCGIQHLAFLCPESQCSKHTRNGPCGGSRNGMCEVHPERRCVWFRVYRRWASVNQPERMTEEYVPPRRWELNRTSSWINFHLGRDHQGEDLFKK